MRKTLCDRCGKDITNKANYIVRVEEDNVPYGQKAVFPVREFCKECMSKIFDVMDGYDETDRCE